MNPRKFILTSILTIALYSCGQHTIDKEVDVYTPRYQSSDASKLRFKNVRSIFYDQEQIPQNKMKILRLKSRPQNPDIPLIHIAIVNNWLYDEAFVLVEPNAWFGQRDTITVKWNMPDSNIKGRYILHGKGKDEMFTFAGQIHQGIIKGYTFLVQDQKGKWIPFLEDGNSREAIRKTMIDFYRLVDLDQ